MGSLKDRHNDTKSGDSQAGYINEVIDIILQRHIILVAVIDDNPKSNGANCSVESTKQ
jgi:hypothetical protein